MPRKPKTRTRKKVPESTTKWSDEAVDELHLRMRRLLLNVPATPNHEGEFVRVWECPDASVRYRLADKTYRAFLLEGPVSEGLVYSGPENDKLRAYIHITGIMRVLEILRKHMVLDDLASV